MVTIEGYKSNAVDVLVGLEHHSAADLFRSFPDFLKLAPDSIVQVQTCGSGLDGAAVTVTGPLGVRHEAQVLSSSPAQVTYVLPASVAPGLARAAVRRRDGTVNTTTIDVQNVQPGLFTTLTWHAVAVGYVVRVRGGTQIIEAFPAESDGPPIDLNPDTDDVYLVIFGTGIRNRSSCRR